MSPAPSRSLPCGACGAPVPLGEVRPGSRIPCPSCGKVLQLGRKKKAAPARPTPRPTPAPTPSPSRSQQDTLIRPAEAAGGPGSRPGDAATSADPEATRAGQAVVPEDPPGPDPSGETVPLVPTHALTVPPEALIESGSYPEMPPVGAPQAPPEPPPPAGDDLAALGAGPVDLSKLERVQTMIDSSRTVEGLRSPLAAYELVRELGRGGMATVYEARQRSLDRRVALKIMAERYSDHPDLVRRFEQEAKALANMSHRNIIGVFDRGHDANLLYFAMEYIDGPSLEQELQGLPGNRMEPMRAVRIMTQVAAALAYTHKMGTIHRDIKPGNIMLAPGDLVKVTDFGLAHVFRGDPGAGARTIVGTPKYMAPEQVQGEAVDHRADIYAMGLVFHEMLAGELPGQSGRTLREILPDLPERIPWLIDRCLETDRTQRFQSAFHVQETLADIALAQGGGDAAMRDAVEGMTEPKSSRPAPPSVVLNDELRRLETQSTAAPSRPEPAGSRDDDSEVRGPIGPPPEVLAAADLAPEPAVAGPGPSPEVDISDILRKARKKKRTNTQAGPSPFGKPLPRTKD